MRVLHVVTNTAYRGSPVFADQLVRHLRGGPDEHQLVALAPSPHDGARLPIDVLGPTPLNPGVLTRLHRLTRTADVVVAHGSRTLPACAIATARGTPFVYRGIGDPLFWANSPARRLRVRLFLHRAAAVAALWDGARDALVKQFGVPARRVTVIPNGVDIRSLSGPGRTRSAARASLGLEPERPTIGMVTALSVEKDVACAVRAVPPGWQLVIAGDGPLAADLHDLARRLLPGQVVWLGMTDGPRAAYDPADVALLTSRTEGLPAAAIEAGVVGLPMVATDVGGVASIVCDGRTGRLVEPGDADAVRRGLLEAYARRGEWGPAAKEHCRTRFSMEAAAASWRALLQSVT